MVYYDKLEFLIFAVNLRKTKTKVMIVDDIEDTRDMLSIMLQKEGFETKSAINGSDFLDKVDVFDPDLVTLDVMMPGLKTDEILEQLKERKSNPKIILLTVVRFSNEVKEKRLKELNIVSYIKKPFDMYSFLDSVKKHI